MYSNFVALQFLICVVNSQLYAYQTVLDHDNNVRLEWSVKENNYIEFKLTLISQKFPSIIGFGFSDHGEFENADFAVFEVRNRDDINIFDGHTDSRGILRPDKTKSDYILVDHACTSTKMVFIFKRKIDTCDPEDYLIETGTTHILHFVYTKKHVLISDVFSGLKGEFAPFSDSTTVDMKQTQLIKSTFFEEPQMLDAKNRKSFEVRVNRIKLPSSETTYWCHVHKLEKRFETEKHHITAFESVISETSEGVVHHMELFHCISDPTNNMDHYSGPCNSEAKPKGLVQCRKVIAAWAMGAGRFEYPSNVGGVIGGKNYSPYLVLEIHFDNANKRSDIIDSSGIRIFYQGGYGEYLRQYDAGILEIGLEYNAKNSIPPQQDEFHLHGYCLSECTSVGLPTNGITIFASQLHTHLTGRRVWTSLVRNNQVVEIVNKDNHYDQMFQEIRMLREPVRVLPGDALINTCVYNTRSRQNMTFGGYSIRDEMCVNYMHYYPVAELEVCKSSISDDVLDSFFTKMKFYDLSETSNTKSIEENFNSIRWTQLTSTVLSKLYDISPIAFSCNSSNGRHINKAYVQEGTSEVIKYFNIIEPMRLDTVSAPVESEFKEECNNRN